MPPKSKPRKSYKTLFDQTLYDLRSQRPVFVPAGTRATISLYRGCASCYTFTLEGVRYRCIQI